MACFLASPCSSSPCLNGAICQVYWNTTNTWFTCLCAGTFTGIRCETSLLNPCGGLCMNGYSLVFQIQIQIFVYFVCRSPCVNGVCVCPSQYTGTFCGYSKSFFEMGKAFPGPKTAGPAHV
jgi:hypothetical protein